MWIVFFHVCMCLYVYSSVPYLSWICACVLGTDVCLCVCMSVPCSQPWEAWRAPPSRRPSARREPSQTQLLWRLLQQWPAACSRRCIQTHKHTHTRSYCESYLNNNPPQSETCTLPYLTDSATFSLSWHTHICVHMQSLIHMMPSCLQTSLHHLLQTCTHKWICMPFSYL